MKWTIQLVHIQNCVTSNCCKSLREWTSSTAWWQHGGAYMTRELPSPQCRSCDCPQKASPPAGRRTCDLSASPKPPHDEGTRTGPNLQTCIALALFDSFYFFSFFSNEKYLIFGGNTFIFVKVNTLLWTCVIMPDADFPNFSKVVICLQ